VALLGQQLANAARDALVQDRVREIEDFARGAGDVVRSDGPGRIEQDAMFGAPWNVPTLS